MATNNFKYENILVVIPDFTFDNRCLDEDCKYFESEGVNCEHVSDYYEFDTEAYNMYIKDMQNHLNEIKLAKNIGCAELDDFDNDRNYTGKIIYEFDIFDKNDFSYRKIYVVIRNGYYQGANIDYVIDENFCDSQATKSEATKLDKQVEVLCKKIEKVLRKYGGEEYLKVASFSNGEAIYQKKLTNK